MNDQLISAVIVDDEPIARRGIRQLLASYDDVTVAGEARNGKQAVRVINALSPDLVFLDVQMPEFDGFAVLRQLDPDRLPCVVFVTAYDAFAVKAFEAHALDYLMKPVSEDRFRVALEHVRNRMRSEEAMKSADRLKQMLASESRDEQEQKRVAKGKLLISTSRADLIYSMKEIVWIEAHDYYAAVYARGRRHLVRESLDSFESRLDRTQFVRVHRRAIVNLSHIREIRWHGAGDAKLVLEDGSELTVSRRRRRSVESALRHFAR